LIAREFLSEIARGYKILWITCGKREFLLRSSEGHAAELTIVTLYRYRS